MSELAMNNLVTVYYIHYQVKGKELFGVLEMLPASIYMSRGSLGEHIFFGE
jgi:hypothetical protein